MWQPGSADGPLPLMTSAARTHPPRARPLVRSDIPSRVCGQRTARPTDQPENSASGLGRLPGQVGTLPDPGHCPEINVVRKIEPTGRAVPSRRCVAPAETDGAVSALFELPGRPEAAAGHRLFRLRRPQSSSASRLAAGARSLRLFTFLTGYFLYPVFLGGRTTLFGVQFPE